MSFNYDRFESDCQEAGGEYTETEADYKHKTRTATCEFEEENPADREEGEYRAITIQDRKDRDRVTANVVVQGRGKGQITNPQRSEVEHPSQNDYFGASETGLPARKTLKVHGDKYESVSVNGEPGEEGYKF